MLTTTQITAIYELAKEEAFKNHKDEAPEKFFFIVDKYLEFGVLAQLWVQAEEQFGSTTCH